MAMRHFLVLALAACTTSSKPKAELLPDHFDETLDVLERSVAQPCGADIDQDGDGTIDAHWRYAYDALGRPMHDEGTDAAGNPSGSEDYTWDNSGHLVGDHTVSLS